MGDCSVHTLHTGDHSTVVWEVPPALSGDSYQHAILMQKKVLECKPGSITLLPSQIQSALTYRRRKSSLAAHRKVFITDNTTPPNSPLMPPCYHWGSGVPGLKELVSPPSFSWVPHNGTHECASEPPYYRRNTGPLLENPDN